MEKRNKARVYYHKTWTKDRSNFENAAEWVAIRLLANSYMNMRILHPPLDEDEGFKYITL